MGAEFPSDDQGRNDKPRVIDYARRGREPVRVSALAVWCMLLSLGACPCLLMPILSQLEDWPMIPSLRPLPVLTAAPVAVIALSAIALARIRRSGGRLKGGDHLYFAFSFSAVWLFALATWFQIR